MPPPLSSPSAPKRLAPPSRRQRSSSLPRPTRSHAHRCRPLTRQHGVSKAAWWPWPLTFWPWKWCPSQVWRGLYLCANFGLPRPLCSRVRPNVRDRPIDVTQTDVRQIERRRTASSLNAPPIKGGGITRSSCPMWCPYCGWYSHQTNQRLRISTSTYSETVSRGFSAKKHCQTQILPVCLMIFLLDLGAS